MTLHVWLPGRLVNPLNARWHWSARARWAKMWRSKTRLLVGATMHREHHERHATTTHGDWPRAHEPKRVSFVAHVHNRIDRDGLIAALKPVVDGLRDAKLLHDDGPTSGHIFVDPAQVIDRKQRGVEVVVELIRLKWDVETWA